MKLTIFLLFLSLNSFSQPITIEYHVWRHMRAKIDSCNALNEKEKDELIKQQDEELQRKQIVIDKMDRLIYDISGSKEDEEIKNFQLTKDYIKLGKKKKRGVKIVAAAGVAVTIIAVVLKHNYDIQKDR